jgi:hypothetical protein
MISVHSLRMVRIRMSEATLNRLTERAVSTGIGFLLIGVVAIVDETVRQRVAGVFSGSASNELALVSGHLQRVAQMTADIIGFQGDHVSPGMFLIAAAVFVVLMITCLRT